MIYEFGSISSLWHALRTFKHLTLALVLASALPGCGSVSGMQAREAFGQDRSLLLRLFEFWDAPSANDLELIGEIIEEATELANSNGLDGRVLRFAELTRAVIEIYVLAGSDGDDLDEVPVGLLPPALQTYSEYFQIARQIASIYAPGFSERIDAAIARLNGLPVGPQSGDPSALSGPASSS